jgi:uncharacterized Fe-S cluster protein YjdI
MTKDIIKRYSNGEITVVWQPSLCVHSGICARGLPQVFDPRRRPWVILDGHTTQQIIDQVDACPSGALSYEKVTVGKTS